MHAEAIAEFQKAIELSGHNGAFDSNLAYAYAASGRRDEALQILAELESKNQQNPSFDANIALVYVGLGRPTLAMTRLDKAYEEHFNPSILLRPAFDPLRDHAQFQDLRRRIGLAE
jgi:Flp pilus assembly protein TadD